MDRAAADLPATHRDARRLHDRRLEAQDLLHGIGDQRRVVPQHPELLGMAQQEPDAVADQVGGRHVAGRQQQLAHRDDLPIGQLVAGLLDGDQRADQVVPGIGATLGQGAPEVRVQLCVRLRDRRQLVVGQEWAEAQGLAVGPALEIVTVYRVDAEHLRDDDHGKRRRERLDQVEPRTPGDRLQELVDDLANARRQPLHGSRREGLADERAQASVSRWILEEQAELPEAREDPHVRALVGVARVDGRGAVSQQALDVGRPGEDPAADHLVVVHGLPCAHPREHGIWISAEGRIQRRQLDAGGNGVRGLVRGLVHHRETSGSAESRWEARSGHRTISHPGAPRE